eukprot:763835-Hanusia_phi.AAC.2
MGGQAEPDGRDGGGKEAGGADRGDGYERRVKPDEAADRCWTHAQPAQDAQRAGAPHVLRDLCPAVPSV